MNRRQFWPIDTGNYQFSRAVAYVGTALAAVEMGDDEVMSLCLAALEEDCPTVTAHGIAYRPKASVWAHAVEFLVRSGVVNGFRQLIARRPHGLLPIDLRRVCVHSRDQGPSAWGRRWSA